MENRAYAIATGIFVLVIAAAVVLWANWLSGDTIERAEYRVVTTMPVTGLNPQAQVRYRGMSVGKVSSIELDFEDPRRILIDIEIDERIPITRGTYAQLGQEGITGIAYVHLQDDRKDTQPAEEAESGYVEIPMRVSFLDDITDSLQAVAKDARALLASMNELLSPENRNHIGAMIASLRKVSGDVAAASGRLPQTAARVDETMKEMPDLARDMRKLVDDARALAVEARGAAGNVGAAAGSVHAETLPRVNALAESVERGADRIGRLANELERKPDSVLWGRPASRPGPGEPGFQ